MTQDDLETVYEAMAEALDEVGPEHSALYLAKLALGLAEEVGAVAPCLVLIDECRHGLERQD